MKYFVYRHIRLDKNEPFYIGIGTKPKKFTTFPTEYKRAFDKDRRSKFWWNIIDKAEYEVEIIFESNDYAFIKQKEKEFIALYGRKDLGSGTLVNLTDGGDGTTNILRSEDWLIKQRLCHLGKKDSEEVRLKKRMSAIGKKKSKEHIRKVAEANRGRKVSKEALAQMRICQLGKKHSQETRMKMSDSRKIYLSTIKNAA